MRLERAIVHGLAYLAGSVITAAALGLVLAICGIVT